MNNLLFQLYWVISKLGRIHSFEFILLC
jgi:hypothetical protein